jgi:hypothetical protein
MPDFFNSDHGVVARKKHKCCECSAPIEKGEAHYKGSGKWDGEFSTYRQHTLCMEACVLIRDELNSGECIGFGDLMEHWADFADSVPWIREKPRNKNNPAVEEFRSIMAKIFWRTRKC